MIVKDCLIVRKSQNEHSDASERRPFLVATTDGGIISFENFLQIFGQINIDR